MSKKILKLLFGIKLAVLLLISSIINSTTFAFEIEYSTEVIKEINKAKTQEQKITIAKRYLCGPDGKEKIEAIRVLGELGGEAVPILLKQLEIELKKEELAWLGGAKEPKKEKSIFARYIIISFGHIPDRRIIGPLIDIVRSKNSFRHDAIRALGEMGAEGHFLFSEYRKKAKPTEGYEISEEEREKIKDILIKSLKDTDSSIRIFTIISLRNMKLDSKDAEDIIPLLKPIAEGDQIVEEIDASLRGGGKGEKIKIYPVREEAEKLLKQLEGKKEDNRY